MSSIVSCNPLKLRIKKKCFLLHLLVRFYIELSINYYIISSVMHVFWLVLTYDLLEDRCIDDVIIKTFFNSLLYKTNRFQVAVRLFSNRSQRTSKCGKNISDTRLHLVCHFFVLTTFWRHLWSSTEQMQLGIYLLITLSFE